MKIAQRLFFALLFGSLAGAVLLGWFSPSWISYYFAPPVDMVLNCKPAVEWGIDTYRKTMLVGAALGAILGGLLFSCFLRTKKN